MHEKQTIDYLKIGLSSWIIQDGNYGDFSRGDLAAFALEFHAENGLNYIDRKNYCVHSLIPSQNEKYKIVGQVVHAVEDWWAIDVGLIIFCEETPPTSAQVGGWFSGEIFIGIDPFFYFESLARLPNSPAIIYDWRIEMIEIQTAPLIKEGENMMVRDATRYGWKEIQKTDAWHDDGSYGEYCLSCSRINASPRHTR